MKKKNWIYLIVALLVIGIGGYFYSFVTRDKAIYPDNYSRNQMVPAILITENNEYSYEFNCDKDNLKGVKLILSGSMNGKLEYCLYDESGKAVTDNETMKISKFKTGKFTGLKFDRIDDSAGHIYKLVLKANVDDGHPVMLYTLPDDNKIPAMQYSYRVWDVQTLVVFLICIGYLWVFIFVLLKIFRK